MTETRISLSYLISVPYLKIAVINSQLDNILHTRHQVVNLKHLLLLLLLLMLPVFEHQFHRVLLMLLA